MGMVDSQPRSSSNRASMDGADDGKEEEMEVLELVPTCWGYPEAYSYPEANIYTPKKSSLRSLVSCLQWRRWPCSNISIASLNFASLSSPSSLANSCTFLISVWRLIKSLTQSTPATVPGQRMRVFFLTRLKGRKIFGLCFLCLSCDIQDLDGILGWRLEDN